MLLIYFNLNVRFVKLRIASSFSSNFKAPTFLNSPHLLVQIFTVSIFSWRFRVNLFIM